ncbi:MAG: glycosyltransferase family 9 protein [Bdellovibrionaceae bacterium]|nr:glycosyltransferase family 9 protein [Bdellovibrionales bacterium]MCB9083378.1 glycosyltransferase family 9 protein [Pseudobdellovibrionaceae bacterium]
MSLQPKSPHKILIIRFSSLGDIIQCLTAADHLAARFPGAPIHWVTRSDFAELVATHPQLQKTWSLDRKGGLSALLRLAQELRRQNFTHLYDAHSNVRSHILSWILRFPGPGRIPHFLRRGKSRLKRWLLFRLGWKLLPWPYHGAQSFVWPLGPWGIKWDTKHSHGLNLTDLKPDTRQLLKWPASECLLLAPSAAWEMKRWPVDYWQTLIAHLPQAKFMILGGPQDHFLDEIQKVAPERVQNLAGLLSWNESARLVSECGGLVSGDTGLLHLGDYLGRPTWALIGPTAFGFPSWPNSHTFEVDLPCRPCTKDGRGECRIKEVRKCLIDIKPESVASELNQQLKLQV